MSANLEQTVRTVMLGEAKLRDTSTRDGHIEVKMDDINTKLMIDIFPDGKQRLKALDKFVIDISGSGMANFIKYERDEAFVDVNQLLADKDYRALHDYREVDKLIDDTVATERDTLAKQILKAASDFEKSVESILKRAGYKRTK